MDLLLSEDQQQIVDSIRDVLRHEFAFERLRRGQPPFADGARSLWPQMAELGWFGLALSESAGGLGLSVAEEYLLLREAGRHLVTPLLMSTVLAAHAAHAAGRPKLVAAFAGGTARAGLVLAHAPLRVGDEVPVYAVDADDCDWLVAWSGAGLWLLEREALRDAQPVTGLDETLPLEKATLDMARACGQGSAPLALRARVLVAAQLCGLAEGARDMAVEYAKVREQFGRPIGSFQAIKHRCADMAVACEVAMCQTAWSAVKVSNGAADAPGEVAAACLLAQRAAQDNAAANIQIHGAMGFSAEGGAHHFLKRAVLLQHAGDAAGLREALLA